MMESKRERVGSVDMPNVDKLQRMYEAFVRYMNKIEGGNVDVTEVMERVNRIHLAVSKASAKIPAVTCKRGCNHCCHMDCDVSLVEMLNIAALLGKTLHWQYAPNLDLNTPCPFLKNDECSIYEFRPLACQGRFSVSEPALCREPKGKSHMLVLSSNAIGAKLSQGVLQWSHAVVRQEGNRHFPVCADIRAWTLS